MEELKTQVLAAAGNKTQSKSLPTQVAQQQSRQSRNRAIHDTVLAEWTIPGDARIICAGLGCVDMQLNDATGGNGGECIETFEGEKSIGGGR